MPRKNRERRKKAPLQMYVPVSVGPAKQSTERSNDMVNGPPIEQVIPRYEMVIPRSVQRVESPLPHDKRRIGRVVQEPQAPRGRPARESDDGGFWERHRQFLRQRQEDPMTIMRSNQRENTRIQEQERQLKWIKYRDAIINFGEFLYTKELQIANRGDRRYLQEIIEIIAEFGGMKYSDVQGTPEDWLNTVRSAVHERVNQLLIALRGGDIAHASAQRSLLRDVDEQFEILLFSILERNGADQLHDATPLIRGLERRMHNNKEMEDEFANELGLLLEERMGIQKKGKGYAIRTPMNHSTYWAIKSLVDRTNDKLDQIEYEKGKAAQRQRSRVESPGLWKRNASDVAEFFDADEEEPIQTEASRGPTLPIPVMGPPSEAALAAFLSKFSGPIEKLKETPHDVVFELPPSEWDFNEDCEKGKKKKSLTVDWKRFPLTGIGSYIQPTDGGGEILYVELPAELFLPK